MNTYWKDYQGDDETFWEHEWAKHGTCISTLDPGCYTDYTGQEEVVDFFQKTVDLFQGLDSYQVCVATTPTPTSSQPQPSPKSLLIRFHLPSSSPQPTSSRRTTKPTPRPTSKPPFRRPAAIPSPSAAATAPWTRSGTISTSPAASRPGSLFPATLVS